MRLNPLLMESLAGEEEYAAGRDLEENGAVRSVSLSLLVGGEPPPVLDFKYDEPERCAPAVVSETAALFADES